MDTRTRSTYKKKKPRFALYFFVFFFFFFFCHRCFFWCFCPRMDDEMYVKKGRGPKNVSRNCLLFFPCSSQNTRLPCCCRTNFPIAGRSAFGANPAPVAPLPRQAPWRFACLPSSVIRSLVGPCLICAFFPLSPLSETCYFFPPGAAVSPLVGKTRPRRGPTPGRASSCSWRRSKRSLSERMARQLGAKRRPNRIIRGRGAGATGLP